MAGSWHDMGCSCCADNWVDEGILGNEDLNHFIDAESVVCLNESRDGAARAVMTAKGWCNRLNEEQYLESDADEQLILTIPFSCAVKIKSITVVGSAAETGSNPAEMRAFINRDDVDFDNVETLTPTQQWELPQRTGAEDEQLHQATTFAKFQNVQTLVLYIPANNGDELTRCLFVGVRGVSTADRRGVVDATYEARAVPSDHPGQAEVAAAPRMGM